MAAFIADILGDSDSETELESMAPEPKRLRSGGAASYRTKFNPVWKKEFPFATSVPNDPYRSIITSYTFFRIALWNTFQ